jgi:hypothetical protein
LEALADSERRHDWIENKKALVLPLDGQNKGSLVVDIFLRIPFSFEEEYKKVEFIELNSGIRIPIVNIDTLIQMKTGTGRGKDEIDILELKRIKVLKEQYNGR